MDYEKVYRKAVEAVKKLKEANPTDEGIQNWVNDNFPNLQESEDEIIRKALVSVFEEHPLIGYDVTNADVLAWLEKQGEKRKITHEEICKSYDISDIGDFSDGYHTFNELYYYRMLYNAAFFNTLPKEWVHKSKKHHDGEECFGGGWFIVMANLPTGQVSNHYELKDWDLFQIPEKETADEWDGHTPQKAADRLHKYLLEKQGDQKVWEHVEPVTEDDKLHLIMDEQNTAWSEEDEKYLQDIIDILDCLVDDEDYGYMTYEEHKEYYMKRINWLKLLKDRVQPQFKQEWSEEDEEIRKLVIARLHSDPNVEFEEYSKEYNWLKSIKERIKGE